jgi:hypothetical protein
MDPYLEQESVWPSFHTGFLYNLSALLNQQLPPRFAARLERHVWLEATPEPESPRLFRPDVFVADLQSMASASVATLALATAAPMTASLPQTHVPVIGTRYLRILDRQDQRVVTVIEVLSPANKVGRERIQYLEKRDTLLAAGTSLVEIDLLRSGPRLPIGTAITSDYYVLGRCPWERPQVGIWPISVRERLPVVPIPLLESLPATNVDLQTVFAQTWVGSRFEADLDYRQPPTPTWRTEDVSWAAERIAAHPQAPQ